MRQRHRGEVWSDCGKKARYRDQSEARVIANRLETKRGDKLRVYECPHCHGFHLSKEKK